MKAGLSEKRNVTPQQAVKILEQNGLKISEKEAEEILDFLYFLGKLTVNQLINKNKDIDIVQHSKPVNSTKSIK